MVSARRTFPYRECSDGPLFSSARAFSVRTKCCAFIQDIIVLLGLREEVRGCDDLGDGAGIGDSIGNGAIDHFNPGIVNDPWERCGEVDRNGAYSESVIGMDAIRGLIFSGDVKVIPDTRQIDRSDGHIGVRDRRRRLHAKRGLIQARFAGEKHLGRVPIDDDIEPTPGSSVNFGIVVGAVLVAHLKLSVGPGEASADAVARAPGVAT